MSILHKLCLMSVTLRHVSETFRFVSVVIYFCQLHRVHIVYSVQCTVYSVQLHRVHIFILSFIIGVSQDNKHFVEIKYSVFKTKLFVNRPVMFNLIQDGLVSQT